MCHQFQSHLDPLDQLTISFLFIYHNVFFLFVAGTSLSPSAGPNPTSPVFPAPPPLVPGTGGKGSDHYHAPANSYAPFIGGAIMGVFALVVIILFAVYCRKRTTKK